MNGVPLALGTVAKCLPRLCADLRAIVAASALTCTLCAVPAAQAQVATQDQLNSINLLPSRGLRLPSTGETAESALAARRESRDATHRFSLPSSSALSRASLVEMPADVVPGRYTRPKYALGFRSNSMKSLAKDMGIDADTCLLPLVRARVSLSQDQGVGGRVMVFARCTFH
jgi:hypothetical protein